MTQKFQHKNGVQTAYTVTGEGTPILFIHGFSGGKVDWTEIARQMSGEYTCITYDLLGHGETTAQMRTDYLGYMRGFYESAVPNVQGLSEAEYTANFEAWLAPIKPKPAIAVLESCQEDLRPSMERFTVPTAYFYADPGSILPVELADYYREHIINAPFTLVPFACETHMFPFVFADEFVEKLRGFLKSLA